MSANRIPSSSVRPIDLIRQATAWARSLGLRIELGSYGVFCGSRFARAPWWVEPGREAIDPLGAVTIYRQPESRHLPDAPAEALDVSIAWVEGCSAGLDKETPSGAWLSSLKRHDYLAGYEAGTMLRTEILTTVCARHNVRHRRVDPCPTCETEVEADLNRRQVEQ
jgi:hypothetical protein